MSWQSETFTKESAIAAAPPAWVYGAASACARKSGPRARTKEKEEEDADNRELDPESGNDRGGLTSVEDEVAAED
mgnify:FL=1